MYTTLHVSHCREHVVSHDLRSNVRQDLEFIFESIQSRLQVMYGVSEQRATFSWSKSKTVTVLSVGWNTELAFHGPLSSSCPPSCHPARHPVILPAIGLLPAIPLLPAILPAIAVPGLLAFSSRLIVLGEVTHVEEVSSSEVGSSGKVNLLESSASRCRGRYCQGGL